MPRRRSGRRTCEGEDAAGGAALALWNGDALVDTLPRTPYRVAQLAGTARGYVIEPFAPRQWSARAGFPRHAHSPRRPMSRGSICSPTRDTPVHASTRAFRKVAAWPEALLFLPALLPLVVGMAIRIGSRRRFA